MGIAALLAVFTVFLGLTIIGSMSNGPAEKRPVVAQTTNVPTPKSAPKQEEPFDITINASELQPQENLADKIPVIVITPQKDARQHPLPPVLEVSVDEDQPENASGTGQAAIQASTARTFAQQGDLKQALRLQHRAVELEPDNMLYRLDLAILYDRVGEKDGAVTLYQQVVQAYDAQDASLPHTLGIDDIRHRLDYLASTGS